MRLYKDIIPLSGRNAGIFYHTENDAVLICSIPTDNQLDGFDEDWDALEFDVTDTETEIWNIIYTFSSLEFLKIAQKVKSNAK